MKMTECKKMYFITFGYYYDILWTRKMLLNLYFEPHQNLPELDVIIIPSFSKRRAVFYLGFRKGNTIVFLGKCLHFLINIPKLEIKHHKKIIISSEDINEHIIL